MSSFKITTPQTSVKLRPSSVEEGETARATVTYDVTNVTGSTIDTRLRIEVDGRTDAAWFTVRDNDRDIGPGATSTFEVDLAVPPGEPGHAFRAVAVNLADSDNDFEKGAAVAFDAPALAAGGGKVPWGFIAAAIVLVAVVGGVIWWLVGSTGQRTVPLKDVVGSELAAAERALRESGLSVRSTQASPLAPELDRRQFYEQIVVDQIPSSDGTTQVDTQREPIELRWEWQPVEVTVPTVTNLTLGAAIAKLEAAGLRYVAHIGPTGDKPSARHYPAVQSASPTGRRTAGTGITLTMQWRQGVDRLSALEHLREFELNQNRVSPEILRHFEDIRRRPDSN